MNKFGSRTLIEFLSLAALVSLAAQAPLFSGCGYSLQGSGSVLPSDIKTIDIRLTENTTTVPGLGPRFAEKLRGRFDRYGVVRVVDSGEDADAELVTKITKLDTKSRETTGSTDISVEQDLMMEVFAELRRKTGQVLYRNNLAVSESFAGVSDVVVTSSSAFAQGGIGSNTLDTLGTREVSRGQAEQVLDELMEEVARKLYLDSVAADF